MKNFLLNKLRVLLKYLSRGIIRKYEPFVVGVTGSVGKTSAKLAISSVLKSKFKIRTPGGNLNNELGLPLAIIGDYKAAYGWFFWIKAVLRGLLWLAVHFPYPEGLVLEYGADRPGDLGYLLSVVKPDIAVVTAVGDVPVHIEFYENAESVAAEKSRLVKSLGANGIAVLNADDPRVAEMGDKAKGKVITFGFGSGAAIRVIGFENKSENGVPTGIVFKVEYGGSFVPVRIDGVLGRSHAYAAAAAAAVGVARGMNLAKISEALAFYTGERGRTRILPGIKNTYIIDDTYNASPSSTKLALEIMKDIPVADGRRKIAVLGDMAELGKYTIEAHDAIGGIVSETADILITVGEKARFMAEGALSRGMAKENIISFGDSETAGKKAQEIMKEGDLVLIKGSQSARMERAVLEVMAEPEKAGKLLVRQYGHWI